jgi:hypothetical protein
MGARSKTLAMMASIGPLAVVGCGGSARTTTDRSQKQAASTASSQTAQLSRSELIARANTVCAHMRTQVRSTAPPHTEQEGIRAFEQAAIYEQAAWAELQKLRPPAALASDWRQLLEDLKTLASDSRTYAAYIRDHNSSGAKTLATSFGPVRQRTAAIVTRDGMSECALS